MVLTGGIKSGPVSLSSVGRGVSRDDKWCVCWTGGLNYLVGSCVQAA